MRGFGTDFATAMYAYLEGELALERAVALAQENRSAAEIEVGAAFQIVPTTDIPTRSSRAERLVQFTWALLGASRCVQEFVSSRTYSWTRAAIEAFLQEQLQHGSEEFSDEDLQLVERYWPALSRDVSRVQTERLSARADHLLEHPRQLTDDLAQVKQYVREYDFGRDLNELLDKVEHGLASSGDGFDQAALLKHLRTFFEQLHKQVGERLRREKPGTVDGTDLEKCGQAVDYLQRKGVLTERMTQFARALYGVLGNEGVHAIKTHREYVRLCRNMVAEYGLILFYELDRRLQEA